LSKDRLFVSGQIDFQAISLDISTYYIIQCYKETIYGHGMKLYYTDRLFISGQIVCLRTDCLFQDRLIFKQYHLTGPHITYYNAIKRQYMDPILKLYYSVDCLSKDRLFV